LAALKQQGDGGVDAITETLAAHRANGGELYDSAGNSTELGVALQSTINSEHGDLKEKDARLTNWAGDGEASSLVDLKLGGLTDQQIATQTLTVLDAARHDTTFNARKGNIKDSIDNGTIVTKADKR